MPVPFHVINLGLLTNTPCCKLLLVSDYRCSLSDAKLALKQISEEHFQDLPFEGASVPHNIRTTATASVRFSAEAAPAKLSFARYQLGPMLWRLFGLHQVVDRTWVPGRPCRALLLADMPTPFRFSVPLIMGLKGALSVGAMRLSPFARR